MSLLALLPRQQALKTNCIGARDCLVEGTGTVSSVRNFIARHPDGLVIVYSRQLGDPTTVSRRRECASSVLIWSLAVAREGPTPRLGSLSVPVGKRPRLARSRIHSPPCERPLHLILAILYSLPERQVCPIAGHPRLRCGA